jgi:hypothetical protein
MTQVQKKRGPRGPAQCSASFETAVAQGGPHLVGRRSIFFSFPFCLAHVSSLQEEKERAAEIEKVGSAEGAA